MGNKLRAISYLSHTSGITTTSVTWATLRTTVCNPPQGNGSRVYSNMNYSLFRVILPFMDNKGECIAKQSLSTGHQTWLANRYVQVMQQAVFSPIGLGVINCIPTSSSVFMMNETGNNNGTSIPLGDWTESTGGGFNMSVMEMARFMASLSQTNTLVSFVQRIQMDNINLLMGRDPEDSQMTVAGHAYGKDGAFWQNANITPVQRMQVTLDCKLL